MYTCYSIFQSALWFVIASYHWFFEAHFSPSSKASLNASKSNDATERLCRRLAILYITVTNLCLIARMCRFGMLYRLHDLCSFDIPSTATYSHYRSTFFLFHPEHIARISFSALCELLQNRWNCFFEFIADKFPFIVKIFLFQLLHSSHVIICELIILEIIAALMDSFRSSISFF